GNTTEAEMADAAMTGKRLKFIWADLDGGGLTLALLGLGSNLRRRSRRQKFIAAVSIITPIDITR
ncbi:hypothetical protein LJD21_12600, partial [Pseudomonas inefficax]|uniref:hypothetical protein n=1 Tax=Pseudomonas inefficax TaxID=2078786 RepID=UPI00207BB162